MALHMLVRLLAKLRMRNVFSADKALENDPRRQPLRAIRAVECRFLAEFRKVRQDDEFGRMRMQHYRFARLASAKEFVDPEVGGRTSERINHHGEKPPGLLGVD